MAETTDSKPAKSQFESGERHQTCINCKHREYKDQYWSKCLSPDMVFTFTPYSMMPFNFRGTIDQFNAFQKPKPHPVTAPDYSCKYFLA